MLRSMFSAIYSFFPCFDPSRYEINKQIITSGWPSFNFTQMSIFVLKPARHQNKTSTTSGNNFRWWWFKSNNFPSWLLIEQFSAWHRLPFAASDLQAAIYWSDGEAMNSHPQQMIAYWFLCLPPGIFTCARAQQQPLLPERRRVFFSNLVPVWTRMRQYLFLRKPVSHHPPPPQQLHFPICG